MLIDTHCHIFLDQFKDDIDEVLDRAAAAMVQHIFMPAINLGSLQQMERLSHPQIMFHKMSGLHPTEINEGKSVAEKELLEICRRDDIVAVGETGLDYYWSGEFKDEQRKSLRLHCRVAKQTGKPIILHNRDSTDDLLRIIEGAQEGDLKGIWHCFNGTAEEGRRAIDAGLSLGIGGMLSFKNTGVDQAVAQLPLSTMVLETDAPYLAPEPHRGQRNEPAFVRDTAKCLSRVMGLSLDEITERTAETALKLFGIDEGD